MGFYETCDKPAWLQSRLFSTRRLAVVGVACCVVFWAGVIALLVVLVKGVLPPLF